MAPGDAIRVANGRGRIATGSVAALSRKAMVLSLDRILDVPRPMELAVLVPVADKDRMLLAAEKCVELQVTAWQPVRFARSASVAGRGEGERFREKVRARMQSALEQSGGAWIPELSDETDASSAFSRVPRTWSRFVLDAAGDPLAALVRNGPTAIAVGPEGGLEPAELEEARALGWSAASLGAGTLRFETAVIAGVAVVRAQHATGER
jgi:16S rRNA (uracil1498-N3)-methyltransferase